VSLETSDDLALFHRTLAELTRMEMPLPKAFRVIAADMRKGKLRLAAEEMAAEAEDGLPLVDAYEEHKDVFPPLYRSLIAAGQATGDVPGVLEEIAAHAATRAQAARRLRRALSYPLVTAIFVLVVGIGALIYAAPRLWLLPTGNVTPTYNMVSGVSPSYGASSQWFEFTPPFMLMVSIGFVLVFVIGAFLFSRFRSPVDLLPGFRWPVFGSLRLSAVRASFASALAMLIRRQTPLPTACELTVTMFPEKCVRERIADMAIAAKRGESLTGALGKSELFPPSLLWLVETAEGSDASAKALDDVAAIYRNRLERGLDRMEVLVTPLAELVIGVAVFFFAYSYLVPLFDYAGGVFGMRVLP